MAVKKAIEEVSKHIRISLKEKQFEAIKQLVFVLGIKWATMIQWFNSSLYFVDTNQWPIDDPTKIADL